MSLGLSVALMLFIILSLLFDQLIGRRDKWVFKIDRLIISLYDKVSDAVDN